MSIGARITAKRTERRLDRARLAASVGLSEAALTRIEEDRVLPRRTITMKLAQALGTTPAFLLGWSEGIGADLGTQKLPLIPVLGVIRAGQPIFAAQHIIGWEPVNITDTDGRFFLRAPDNLLADAGIRMGSRVLFSVDALPSDGDVIACTIGGGEVQLRLWKELENGRVALCSASSMLPAQTFSAREFDTGWVRMLGVAEQVTMPLR